MTTNASTDLAKARAAWVSVPTPPAVKKTAFFDQGICLCADSSDESVISYVKEMTGKVPLIVADPPYGGILPAKWDQMESSDKHSMWMSLWTVKWAMEALQNGGAFYVWGGIGKPRERPFFKYILQVEKDGVLSMSNLITWSKKRAYGLPYNYLFTREEIAYFVKGVPKKPRTFHIPLLDKKRGYDGYDKNRPAKSEYLRRTNVWTDVTEIFRGKEHPAQKPERLHEIIIQTHTDEGDIVIDPFAGIGTTGLAAISCDRRFVLIENDPPMFDKMVDKIFRRILKGK